MKYKALPRLIVVGIFVMASQYLPLKELFGDKEQPNIPPTEIKIPKPKPEAKLNKPASAPENFREAKEALRKFVYFDQNKTLYCGCDITWKGSKGAGAVNLASCGYSVRKNPIRANRVEWEHVMSASTMAKGRDLSCWKQGGRKLCQSDPLYLEMASNLHNLHPSNGEANADRSNFDFASWSSSVGSNYGQCDLKVDFKNRKVSPPEPSRGQIARAILYMSERYEIPLSTAMYNEMWHWHQTNQVSDWECLRDRRIAKIQGDHNPFVKQQCI